MYYSPIKVNYVYTIKHLPCYTITCEFNLYLLFQSQVDGRAIIAHVLHESVGEEVIVMHKSQV
jgi:hypothetical protein